MLPVDHSPSLKTCANCTIRHRSVCGALNANELSDINRISRRRNYQAGQTIFHEGEHSDFFANIVRGVVKLTKTMSDGRQHIVGVLFAADFIGRAMREQNPYLAVATTEVELCIFPRAEFQRLMDQHRELEHRLFSYTLDELDACRDWTLLLGRKTATERVASFLLLVASRILEADCAQPDNADSARFQLPVARADIADFLGLTTESVSRQMTRLKMAGIINLSGKRDVHIPALSTLRRVADLVPCHDN
jgi:CRP/FNR family transcriptional regulator